MFISLLLVTVGIVYSKVGSNINVIVSILFDGENISFEARLVSELQRKPWRECSVWNEMNFKR